MSLYATHESGAMESEPFLRYLPQKHGLKDGLEVKYMSFAKLIDDSVRYDFYYNCSTIMTYFNLTPIAAASKIIEKYVPRFHEIRYDLVQIFNETFNMDEKFGKEINKEYQEFENVNVEDDSLRGTNGTVKDADENSNTIAWRSLGSVGSFLLVGLLKYIMSFECVKNMLKDRDEEEIKEYRKSISQNISDKVLKFLGDDDAVDDIG